jgi:predicted DNA-binding protein (UPF0251 family)
MARPPKCRRIGFSPTATYFKPRGIGMALLEEVSLELDEVEALRLADLESLYQAEAAERMGVSRQTFANIVERARKKVADAIIHGKALRIALADASNIPLTTSQPCCKEKS